MKKIFKIALSFLLILTTSNLFSLPMYVLGAENDTKGNTREWTNTDYVNNKGYLVLMQDYDSKTWVAHKNLVVKSPSGNLMLRAYAASKALGLEYIREDYDSPEFEISNGIKKLHFKSGKKAYTYDDGDTKIEYNAAYAPYLMKGDRFTIHYASLGKIMSVKYFNSSEANEYKKNGYSGVIVFKQYKREKINELPDINDVVDVLGNKIVYMRNDTPLKGNSTIISIGGVKVPILSKFKKPKDTEENCFGNDTSNNFPYYNSLKDFDDNIHKAMLDMGVIPLDDVSTVINFGDTISISLSGSHSQHQVMKLEKNIDKNQYELTLKVRLYKSEYSTIYRNSLRLLLASFTSEIDTLYKAIYSEWEGNNDYGINKKSFVTVGDCKIKYVSSNGQGYGTYIIKAK